jgi:hypothetical protein
MTILCGRSFSKSSVSTIESIPEQPKVTLAIGSSAGTGEDYIRAAGDFDLT